MTWWMSQGSRSTLTPRFFSEPAEAGVELRKIGTAGDVILFKGSRGTRLNAPSRALSPPLDALLAVLRKAVSPYTALPRVWIRDVPRVRQSRVCVALGPCADSETSGIPDRQVYHKDGPKSHMKKAGTPTMGGILIISVVVIHAAVGQSAKSLCVDRAFGMASFGLIASSTTTPSPRQAEQRPDRA